MDGVDGVDLDLDRQYGSPTWIVDLDRGSWIASMDRGSGSPVWIASMDRQYGRDTILQNQQVFQNKCPFIP